MLFGCGVYIFFCNFSKKLFPLISMELLMILLVYMFYTSFQGFIVSNSCMMVMFLVLMVLDSVLGLSILISSCRFPSKKTYSFF